ncbi:MAG: hypothetical protein JNN28_10730 [Saprospiraceae bacterium]|nr:hypothetical protein [Saprospiraceae bacterium]
MRHIYLSIAACIFSLSNILHAQNIWYVNASSQVALPDGSSWQEAFPRLQDALQVAQYGDQIWVAAGTYTPTQTAQRDISFVLKNGVALLGGFAGTESAVEQRNPILNLTRLSGNIGDSAIDTDNSFHVLTGTGLDEKTVLDGFTISDGNSIGAGNTQSDQYGAGLFLLGSEGLSDSRPLIANCVFEHNKAEQGGGGLFVGHINPSNPFGPQYLVNPQIRNCNFVQNQTTLYGAGMMKTGSTAPIDTFLLENCRFTDNYAFAAHGGGVHIEKTGNSTIALKDCIFELNETLGGNGGGLNVTANSEGAFTIDLIMEGCIFLKNRAPEGAGFYIDGLNEDPIDYIVNLFIKNCLFEENEARNATGGAYTVYLGGNGIVNATIGKCQFLRNVANSYFATAFICNDESEANVLVENSAFIGNRQKNNPNSYFVAYSAGGNKVHSRLNNCLFANNPGGAIFAGGHEETKVLTEVTNCTFYNNGANPFGKRWYSSFNQTGAQYYNKMNFYNCAIWEPQSNHRLIYNNNQNILNGSWFLFEYCSISPLVPSPAVIPNYMDVFGDSVYHNVYPGFIDTLGGNFRLNTCSPVLNRGSNTAIDSAGLTSDFDGQPRIRFGRVDLGAYEQQDSCLTSSTEEPEVVSSGKLWPNPASPGYQVQWEFPDGAPKTGYWQVLDSFGRLLLEGSDLSTGITAPSIPGIYWVILYIGQQTIQRKLVVQR